jgi:hypothetical protein
MEQWFFINKTMEGGFAMEEFLNLDDWARYWLIERCVLYNEQVEREMEKNRKS